MKKILLLGGGLLAGGSSFAQESGTTIDLSAAGSAATSMANSFSTMATGTLLPAALVVITALVVLWIAPKIPGLISLGKKRG